MSVSKATLLFAVFIFIGYQAGFIIASRLFPSALMLVIFPAWMAAIGFAFITLPVAWSHGALVNQYIRRMSPRICCGRTLAMSTLVVLPVIAVLIWLNASAVHTSFHGGVLSPDDDAFRVSNAVWNVIVRYSVTFLVAALGSTCLMLRQKSRDNQSVCV
jgi:hypothetical protein